MSNTLSLCLVFLWLHTALWVPVNECVLQFPSSCFADVYLVRLLPKKFIWKMSCSLVEHGFVPVSPSAIQPLVDTVCLLLTALFISSETSCTLQHFKSLSLLQPTVNMQLFIIMTLEMIDIPPKLLV